MFRAETRFTCYKNWKRVVQKNIILEQVKVDKPYIGESAGSIIMSPNISYAKDMDVTEKDAPQLKSFEGLGLVDFYPLPHYKSFPFEEVTKRCSSNMPSWG